MITQIFVDDLDLIHVCKGMKFLRDSPQKLPCRDKFQKKCCKLLHNPKKLPTFASQNRKGHRKNGSLAEWLGAGLQNRLQQFDSARNLQCAPINLGAHIYFIDYQYITYAY